MLNRIKIPIRSTDAHIVIPITIQHREVGFDDTIEKFVSERINDNLKSTNLKEKIIFKNNDNRVLKFLFLNSGSMTTLLDNIGLSKITQEDLANYYKSQFIVELFSGKNPVSQKKIDTFHITLYKTITLNKSEFNLNYFIPYLSIPEKYLNDELYLRFSFFNSKDNKKYLFQLGNNTEITNDSIFQKIELDNTTKQYKLASNNLDLYQAVRLNKKGVPEDIEDSELLPEKENNEDIETTPNNANAILNETGLFTTLVDSSFSCYLNTNLIGDEPDEGTIENPFDVYKDFYNPRFPVVTVKLVGYERENLTQNAVIHTGDGSSYYGWTPTINLDSMTGAISSIGNYYDIFGDTPSNLFFEAEVTYHSTYIRNSANTFPRPYQDLPAVPLNKIFYNIGFTSSYIDTRERYVLKFFETVGLSFLVLSDNISFPYEGELNPNQTLKILLVQERVIPESRPQRLTGFFDLFFSTESGNINVMYLDKNNKLITTNFIHSQNPTKFSDTNDYYVNPDNGVVQQGISYEPVDYVRFKIV